MARPGCLAAGGAVAAAEPPLNGQCKSSTASSREGTQRGGEAVHPKASTRSPPAPSFFAPVLVLGAQAQQLVLAL